MRMLLTRDTPFVYVDRVTALLAVPLDVSTHVSGVVTGHAVKVSAFRTDPDDDAVDVAAARVHAAEAVPKFFGPSATLADVPPTVGAWRMYSSSLDVPQLPTDDGVAGVDVRPRYVADDRRGRPGVLFEVTVPAANTKP